MKRGIHLLRREERVERIKTDDDGTPSCVACGEHNIKLGSDAAVILRGRWMPHTKHDVPVFVVDPETLLFAEELPNRQIILIPDIQGHPTKHAHVECLESLIDDMFVDEYEPEDEEEED